MNQLRFAIAATGAAGLFAAIPAAAVVKVAKYTGTVTTGYDATGLFGAPGASLAGYGYVATYKYDKTLGTLFTDGSTYERSTGGAEPSVSGPSPMLSSSITINGVTRTIAGSWEAVAETSTGPFVQHYASDFFDDGITQSFKYHQSYAYPAGAPASLDQSFGPVAAQGYGYIAWAMYDYATGTLTENTYAYLGTNTVYSVSDVPEPATWALMIAGFGMVGGALRRQERLAAA